MKHLRSAIRAVVPFGVRRRLSDVLSDRVDRQTRAELEALGCGAGPIIVGPWVGEVGFELLYWIPFLQWALEAGRIERSRITVVSRGGTASWYHHIADHYVDVLDLLSEEEFQSRNRHRHAEVGEQKQVRLTTLEADIIGRVAALRGLHQPKVLHPGLMYRLLNPYWWGHRPVDWVEQHARFRPLAADLAGPNRLRASGASASLAVASAEAGGPALHPVASDLPRNYAAVKFYFNDCFPATSENRAFALRVVREMADEGPVVSLATGLRLDDHRGWEEEEKIALSGIRGAMTPSTNLAFQTRVVAGARVWAGTYGGFAYLAPFHRVPARAFYSDAGGFSGRHLELALNVFSGFGRDLLRVHNAQWPMPNAQGF